MDRLALIDSIEAVIHQDVGRDITPLFAATRGGLKNAVTALSDLSGPVGLITGFYVPGGTPPAAETDGPVGAALLAMGLRRMGLSVRLCTDVFCASACEAALAGAGLADVPLDVVPGHGNVEAVVMAWREARVEMALAIERCGRTRDGAARNMRGHDVGAHTTLLDDVFLAGPWSTMAIGDGGNEIGMGGVGALVAAHIKHGAAIACVTPATHLIVAGVSHWGAYALLGGLATMRDDWRTALLDCLDPDLDRTILEATLHHGPAVDGVTGQQAMTIDGLDCAAHHSIMMTIRTLVETEAHSPAPS